MGYSCNAHLSDMIKEDAIFAKNSEVIVVPKDFTIDKKLCEYCKAYAKFFCFIYKK